MLRVRPMPTRDCTNTSATSSLGAFAHETDAVRREPALHRRPVRRNGCRSLTTLGPTTLPRHSVAGRWAGRTASSWVSVPGIAASYYSTPMDATGRGIHGRHDVPCRMTTYSHRKERPEYPLNRGMVFRRNAGMASYIPGRRYEAGPNLKESLRMPRFHWWGIDEMRRPT